MLMLLALAIYAFAAGWLKHMSHAYEDDFHAIFESMAAISEMARLKKDHAIEMAILCNSSFWLLLSPLTILAPSQMTDTAAGWWIFWGLRIYLWTGAALSIKPFFKGVRYLFGERPGVLARIAHLRAEAGIS